MNDSLRRAARRALKPNAIILGTATCLFGWSLAEALRPAEEYGYLRHQSREILCLASALLLASVSLATKRASGNLLAAALSGPLPLLLIFSFFVTWLPSEVSFLSIRHVELWLRELARAPVSIWLMTAHSFAILCSATAATLRRTPPALEEFAPVNLPRAA